MIPSLPIAPVQAVLAPVQWIIDALKPVLIFFHDSIGLGWGMSIVLLTVCVRACLAPLTVKQFKSMQAMVRVAPELKALQAKYKDDKQRQQQEVMKFYAENKINPFASCLPLVAQMPFFIGLFYLLRTDLRKEICGSAVDAAQKAGGKLAPCGQLESVAHHVGRGAEQFLFIPDLTDKATGWVLGVLIVLYVGSQLLSSVLTPSTADRNQRMLMYGLPFVFVFFVINFPSGLIVYWITTNLWTVTQGYVLRRRMGPISAPKVAVAGGPDLDGSGGGGLMARLASATGAGKRDGGAAPAAESKPPRGETAGAKSSAKGGTPAVAERKKAPARASKGAGKTAAPAATPPRDGPPPQPPRKKKKRSGRRR
ncbi:MAG TPA: YidC/Oxa1 family membrane protein insertase [Solirubrobacteraceae bacterium]|jgi:YidC/Oxa1 family membrane protein insertase|nr:YidC/Oxa1 family membrane protein insertase [Solirubrobacteraceae bacterium]